MNNNNTSSQSKFGIPPTACLQHTPPPAHKSPFQLTNQLNSNRRSPWSNYSLFFNPVNTVRSYIKSATHTIKETFADFTTEVQEIVNDTVDYWKYTPYEEDMFNYCNKLEQIRNLIALTAREYAHVYKELVKLESTGRKEETIRNIQKLKVRLSYLEDDREGLELMLDRRLPNPLWPSWRHTEKINKLNAQLKTVQDQIEKLEDVLIESGLISQEELKSKILLFYSKICTLLKEAGEDGNITEEIENELDLLKVQKNYLEEKLEAKKYTDPSDLSKAIFILTSEIKEQKKVAKNNKQEQIHALVSQKEDLEKKSDLRHKLLVLIEKEKSLTNELMLEKYSPNPVKCAWENLSTAFQLHEKSRHPQDDPYDKPSLTEKEIKDYQRSLGIPSTGDLDEETLKEMVGDLHRENRELGRELYTLHII